MNLVALKTFIHDLMHGENGKMRTEKYEKDRIRGSIVGGAIGDALGYPVEFLFSFDAIQNRYGERGITSFDMTDYYMRDTAKAEVSDDTQMTLFTACGILNAAEKGMAPVPAVTRAYLEWLYTQGAPVKKVYNDCWIAELPELNVRRAPGGTCISSLKDIARGGEPNNNSKGCGGVMRIAPVPLYGFAKGRITDVEALDKLSAEISEVTHQHPLGFIPSAFVSHIIYQLACDENPTREALKAYVEDALNMVANVYKQQYQSDVEYFDYLVRKAVALASEDGNDVDNIGVIGEGWVAEETAAIAVYCALKYFDNFEEALIASVNHKGDSDSTGAVTGNILGAAIGYDALPAYYKDNVELLDVMLQVCDDLWEGKKSK